MPVEPVQAGQQGSPVILAALQPKQLLPDKVYDKIAAVHNSSKGHWEQRLTRKRLNDLSITDRMISQFIRQCPCYQVMSRIHLQIKTQSIYIIEDLVHGKRTTTHIHNLRPFNYDPVRTVPLDVAQHNEQEFVVEAINGHRGDRHKRSTMEFRVRWAGFGETCDGWEPYKAFLHVDKLHNYLRANAMKSLIPSEHK